jgi:hypothetical protein
MKRHADDDDADDVKKLHQDIAFMDTDDLEVMRVAPCAAVTRRWLFPNFVSALQHLASTQQQAFYTETVHAKDVRGLICIPPGPDMLYEVRAQPRTSDTPVRIIITHAQFSADVELYKSSGSRSHTAEVICDLSGMPLMLLNPQQTRVKVRGASSAMFLFALLPAQHRDAHISSHRQCMFTCCKKHFCVHHGHVHACGAVSWVSHKGAPPPLNPPLTGTQLERYIKHQ